jgi:hypothetical protein
MVLGDADKSLRHKRGLYMNKIFAFAATFVIFAAPAVAQSIVIYESTNFKGRSKTVEGCEQRLTDFGTIPSSIRVPSGWVAVLYAQADEGGGYGISVDLLEDHADLSQLKLGNKISYIKVFHSKDPKGFFWSRNRAVNGTFLAGHWQRMSASGTPPVETTPVVSPPLPPHAPGTQPPPCTSGPIVRDHRPNGTPASVLEITYRNVPFDTSKQSWPHWAQQAVRGKLMFPDFADTNIVPGTRIFSSPDYSKNEWTQLLNQDEDYEVDVVGASGRAIIMPDGNDGQSGNDVPFTHPFGKDWEFYIAPDTAYQNLAAPPAPPPFAHAEYAKSVAIAKDDFGLNLVNTLGVEMEGGLIPFAYRVRHGDRVAVWGRWIVDTGHPDFHTEIHPPLLLATARAPSSEETTTTVIGRPYLVSQRWPGGPGNLSSLGVIDHLLEEADKVPLNSFQAEAHPVILPKAFTGLHTMSYTVRPPSARNSPADRLMVTFHFTVRSGVAVQVVNSGDSVSVYVVMNGNVNQRATLPTRHDLVIDRAALKKMDSRAGNLYLGKEVESGLESAGIGAALLAKGVLTDRYDAPVARSVHDDEVVHVPVTSLSGNTPFSVDDGQPFPIYGQLTLTWERGTSR